MSTNIHNIPIFFPVFDAPVPKHGVRGVKGHLPLDILMMKPLLTIFLFRGTPLENPRLSFIKAIFSGTA